MPSVIIREATPDDANAISKLHGAMFPRQWRPDEFIELMTHPRAIAQVACDMQQMEIAGYVLGRVAADEAELLSIGIAPDRRRQGLAQRLVGALMARAREMGATRLHLEVAAVNTPALALYAALGFERTGLRRGYYHTHGQPAEDAHLLALDILPNPCVD